MLRYKAAALSGVEICSFPPLKKRPLGYQGTSQADHSGTRLLSLKNVNPELHR